MEFQKTKAGLAICPFFSWTSENIGEEDKSPKENDVNLTNCSHPDNPEDSEGNCSATECPLLNPSKGGMTPKQIHDIEQSSQDIAEQFVPVLHTFYCGCINTGFTIDQAFDLTKLHYCSIMNMNRPKE